MLLVWKARVRPPDVFLFYILHLHSVMSKKYKCLPLYDMIELCNASLKIAFYSWSRDVIYAIRCVLPLHKKTRSYGFHFLLRISQTMSSTFVTRISIRRSPSLSRVYLKKWKKCEQVYHICIQPIIGLKGNIYFKSTNVSFIKFLFEIWPHPTFYSFKVEKY